MTRDGEGNEPTLMPWGSRYDADPLGDVLAMSEYVYEQVGLQPTRIITSMETKIALERFQVWLEETTWRLDQTPRWRVFTRLSLKRQLHGGVWHRSRLRRRWSLRWYAWRHRNDPEWW